MCAKFSRSQILSEKVRVKKPFSIAQMGKLFRVLTFVMVKLNVPIPPMRLNSLVETKCE